MEKWLNKAERKFGRYAIRNLSLYIVGGYALGFVLMMIAPAFVMWINLDPYKILHGQIWRIITWMIIPPSGSNILFLAIMLMFYYSIGTELEQLWGSFRYNVYIFSGVIFTIIGAILLLLFRTGFNLSSADAPAYGQIASLIFTTYYVNLSIFLAFAASYPDKRVMLYFIIPIKIKWLAYLDVALLLYSFIGGGAEARVAITASLLNFIVFFLSTRNMKRITPKEIHRKQVYRTEVRRATGITKHKCAICGRTEEDEGALEFRFCSKCDGNYEYCQDHLFTHEHVKNS